MKLSFGLRSAFISLVLICFARRGLFSFFVDSKKVICCKRLMDEERTTKNKKRERKLCHYVRDS